jgi:MYXO-CTERM domain-containing protein
VIGEDEEVRGGAFTCTFSGPASEAPKLGLLLGVGLAAGLARRRRRPTSTR